MNRQYKKHYKLVDSCRTYTILLQDSGLLPKPRENWNTFVPHEGDYAEADGIVYKFDGIDWVEVIEEDEY